MRRLYCCKLTTFVIGVGCVFFAAQAALLVLCVLLIGNTRAAEPILEWAADRASTDLWAEAEGVSTAKEFVSRRLSDFLAVPITLNIVLMMSNAMLVWGAIGRHRLLLWPWIVLYAVEWIAAAAAVVYVVIALKQDNIKVLAFLISCPFIVVFGFCWLAVKSLDNAFSDAELKEAVAAVYNKNKESAAHAVIANEPPYQPLSTVYSCEQRHWDQPLPVWATLPARTVWDPYYLQQLDPRFGANPVAPTTASYAGSHYATSKKSRSKRAVSPTRLPDGTLVVPINEETPNEDEDFEKRQRRRRRRSAASNSTSLSEKYKSNVVKAPLSTPTAKSDVSSSVVSLSDKYRQQDEVEVFEEFYPAVASGEPPKPVPPKQQVPK